MILELCKGVHCVHLGESFQTHIYLQNLALIQPRTSPVKAARSTMQIPVSKPPQRFGQLHLGTGHADRREPEAIHLSRHAEDRVPEVSLLRRDLRGDIGDHILGCLILK